MVIFSQACGSGFNCKSTQVMIIGHYNVPQRNAAKQCSWHIILQLLRKWFQISLTFNFTSIVLSEQAPDLLDSKRVKVESAVKEKTLTMSQRILQHTFGIHTPLEIATTHSLFNQTHSKSLITLNNRLAQGIKSCSRWKKLVCTFHKTCLTTGRCHTSLQWTI